MLNWTKEFWERHKGRIIPTVVGGVILAAILSLSQKLRELAIKGLEKIQNEITLPFYWLLITFAFGVVVTRLLAWRANKKSIEYYNMDEIQGLVWEWDIYNFDSSLKPLCPKCLAELPIRGDHQQVYICVSCGFKKKYDYTHNSILDLVKIEIEKRERTKEWKGADRRIKAIQANYKTLS